MFKRFFNKNMVASDHMFPQPNSSKTESILDNKSHNHGLSELTESAIVNLLLESKQFMTDLAQVTAKIVLDSLVIQYKFEPTDKYKEEIANKKKYIGQLDSYLQERKEINRVVEGELNSFLEQTTTNLTMALESFAALIKNRIREAEAKHGVDVIKQSILDDRSETKESYINE